MTLDEIVRRNGERFPDKTALAMDARAWTWAKLDERVNRLCNAFADVGLRAGDRVAILLSNCPEYFEIYFACARYGSIAVPINYRLTPRELDEILQHAEPSLFIAGGEYIQQVQALQTLDADRCTCWWLDVGTRAGYTGYEQMLSAATCSPLTPGGLETDTLAIFYTSGTTDVPKGAMVSHLNLEANAYNQIIADESRRDDINLVATPIYHVGAVFMAITYMMLGCTQHILRKFEPGAWLSTMQGAGCTVSLLIPTMINALINDARVHDTDLSALRLIFYGGGPMPPAVLERAIKVLDCGFTQGYGLTETLEATFLVAADHVPDGSALQRQRLASAGREAVAADVRIVDADGRVQPSNEVGEILIRSRSVICGYWRMPNVTKQAIRDGWFYTGDMGYLDGDRYLFVVDRKKDMVVSGGVNIYSKEIENLLYQHPAILEAAIIGLADEEWGEVVAAVIVRRKEMDLSATDVIRYCRDGLASFKKPRRVFFLDELPKNPSGKVLKRDLRDRLQTCGGDRR